MLCFLNSWMSLYWLKDSNDIGVRHWKFFARFARANILSVLSPLNPESAPVYTASSRLFVFQALPWKLLPWNLQAFTLKWSAKGLIRGLLDHIPSVRSSTLIHEQQIRYRVFIQNCIFSKIVKYILEFWSADKKSKYMIFHILWDFLNSASSAAALVFYLPGVCTHTETEGKQSPKYF